MRITYKIDWNQNSQKDSIIQINSTAFTKKQSTIIEPMIRPRINVINDHRIAFL